MHSITSARIAPTVGNNGMTIKERFTIVSANNFREERQCQTKQHEQHTSEKNGDRIF
jgi:hypothetical protein